MTAKTAAQRQQEKRERDKMSKEDREARLLSRRIVTDLYHNDDAALKRVMARAKIEEEQDMISRLIRGADRIIDQADFDSHIRIA
jgi:protocatechuate 3,4-dioxygenase beta subunit